ncbi:hypothetical protein ACHAXR_002049, partial [Thalassiosira sp. AJA248-18]
MTTLKQTTHENDVDQPAQEAQDQQCRPLVIVLAGPTAVGKSDVAAELCSPAMAADIISSQGRHQQQSSSFNRQNSNEVGITKSAVVANNIRGHVVSADSVQAYRGVDIGANKPTLEEMKRTPHHLVNVVDPPTDPAKAASYNAADWMKDASYVIRQLTSFHNEDDNDVEDERGESTVDHDELLRRQSIEKVLSQSLGETNSSNDTTATYTKPIILPVVVGGTMMYLQWLVHGRPDAIRPTDEAVDRAASKIDEFREEEAANSMAVKKAIDHVDESSERGDATTTEEGASEDDIAAWNAASAHVSSLGPVFAQRVDKLPGRDWYRLRRLLEVAYTIASKKKTATKDAAADRSEEEILQNLTEKEVYTGIRSGSLPDLGYDIRCFFLCPDERMTHFHTVDQR